MELSSSSRARVHNMHHAEEEYEDIPPVLPPLQEFRISSIPDSRSRPSPLEPRPNGRVNTQAQSTPLSNRQKALAQAKPIENCDLEIDPRILSLPGDYGELGEQAHLPQPPNPEQARKKAKLRHNEQIADFVHLPTPQPRKKNPKEDRLPPLRPIAELNEPPSGAARFPPITPRSTSHSHQEDQEHEYSQRLPKLLPKGTVKPSRRAPLKRTTPGVKKPRVYTRERTKWTEAETDHLVKGIAIYGMGRWKHILDHSEFDFHPSRTHVDLKDRCRVVFPQNESHKWVRPLPEHVSGTDEDDRIMKTPKDKPRLRKRKQAWTEFEDAELARGFRIHGFQWQRIASDESLNFDNRTGSNIRDRFRLKYPVQWKEPRPAPLAPPPPRKPQGGTKGVGSRGGKGQGKDKQRKDTVTADVSEQGPQMGGHDGLDDIDATTLTASRSATKDAVIQAQPQGQGSDWLDNLLNEEWNVSGGTITLPPPPVRWEDMAVPTPMFDLG